MKVIILTALLASSLAFDVTSQYIVAKIAQEDLTAHNKAVLTQVEAMLEPLNKLSGAGKYPFLDAAAWPTEVLSHGVGLPYEWHYQNNPLFDGVDEHEVEDYDRYNLLNEMTYSLFAVDATSSSRIDKTFSKSYMLRYIMNLIGEAHSPMHNINLFNSKHKQGDNHGKDFKLTGDHKTLFDLWDNSFGLFTAQTYPLSSDSKVTTEAKAIMDKYSREDLATELKADSKKGWSDASFAIAQEFAYAAAESKTPSEEYIQQGIEQLEKQIALAGYRVADQLVYCMSKQE